MFKKILIIIIVILVITAIALFIWAFLISKRSGGEVTVRESFQKLLPFGGGGGFFIDRDTYDFNTASETGGILGGGNIGSTTLPRLRQISTFPVAGATIAENEDLSAQAGGKALIRFIARENGHIFEMPVDSATQERISNTTILRIWDTLWLSDGSAFVARFIDEESSEIESFYAEIKESETEEDGSVDGVFLPKNIKEFAISDKDKIFYLTASGGGSVGVISDPDGDNKIQIFSSSLSQWNVEWRGGDKISLTTKASYSSLGYLYFLNSKTEKLEKILSAIMGLTTLVKGDGTKVLFTQNEGNRLLLSVLDIKKDTITDLPVWTLSEKCVWSELNENIIYCGVPNVIPQGKDLDLWYQGITSFSDSIWMIDIETQTGSSLINPVDIVGKEIDLIKPILSADEDYLIFTNKKDSTLWSFKI